MNQSAIRFFCSCVVLATAALSAQAGDINTARELEQNIRQRSVYAHKVVKQDAIKQVMSKTVLMSQLQASLNQQATVALNTVVAVREPGSAAVAE
jgi:hypothetical protein